MFEDVKGVISSRNTKDRRHNGEKKRDTRTNNDLQNITQKTKDRATRIPQKLGGYPEGLAVPVPRVSPVGLLLGDTHIIYRGVAEA